MTVLSDLRDRIASALTLELSHRGITADPAVASAVADRAVIEAGVEPLTAYVAAVEGGTDPADARTALGGDGILQQILVEPAP
ncbi:hypothetical protein [Brevundimonas sp. A19_0]|uniref:hypothetical protein n=1 Tax=Brevundimonas sp. A19_0 TaxID=2821087 RepID=UPI001ADA1D20|nr:hypothetical protein [Brevundimonas sp. A19_0]MBO9502051.1 hypothetical protein [Brevundimonas sp. A19_0]